MVLSALSRSTLSAAALLACISGAAIAQPTIVSLGTGSPLTVTNSNAGTITVGGSNGTAVRWSLTGSTMSFTNLGGAAGGPMSSDGLFHTAGFLNVGPSVRGNTATGVSPAHSATPTLIPSTTLPPDNELGGRWWNSATNTWTSMGGLPVNGALKVFGSSSGGQPGASFLTPNGISSNGRYVVGLGYACVYNAAGTAVSANSFRWRPWVWDSQGNGGLGAMTVLPTPLKTTAGQTNLFRTGNAYAVSADGLVIAGAQEHNVGGAAAADADGGRYVVWRWNTTSNSYVMTYLDARTDTNGFPAYFSSTPSSLAMNSAGTIIVANTGYGITKWVWDSGTQSWGTPIVIGSNLTVPASWLPFSVTSCGLPPQVGLSIAMSEDGNTVVGTARYSTCGSFMSAGFIWTAASGQIRDWYDYLVAQGSTDVTANYGPIGDGTPVDPTKGLPRIGTPVSISPDGTVVSCQVLGPQFIVGAPPTVVHLNGGTPCVTPTVTTNPAATTNFSACSSSIVLNAGAGGTAPFTYQWFKDGNPLVDGIAASGSNVTGATSFQLRVQPVTGSGLTLSPADAGTYYAVITGACGSPAQTTNAVVQVDPAFPVAANDVCSGAINVNSGTNVLGTAGENPCGAFVNDPFSTASCFTAGTKTDRWYTFTPTTTGIYRVDTCGSNFDTVLSVYDGCSGSELACNNDYLTGTATGCSSNRSRTAVSMTAGIPYKVRVSATSAAFLSSSSVINLSINPAPTAAANDNCSTATTAVVGANPFDLTEASNDWLVSCNGTAARDVWFRFTPTATGKVKLSTCGTTLNTVLSVHPDCGAIDTFCNDNAGLAGCTNQSVIDNLEVTAGITFFIRVAGNSATAIGTGNVTISTIGCDSLDFNNDGTIEPGDVDAYFSILGEGPCLPEENTCSDLDFNNDGDIEPGDVDAYFSVLGEGPCLP